MVWGLLSSYIAKSSFFRLSTSLPDLSRTMRLTITRLVLVLKVAVSCASRTRQGKSRTCFSLSMLEPEPEIRRHRPHPTGGDRQSIIRGVHDGVQTREAYVIGQIGSLQPEFETPPLTQRKRAG